MMLVGMEACKDKDFVWASYHNEGGLFETFIRNGLEHSNRVLSHEWYRLYQWEVTGLWYDSHNSNRGSDMRFVECENTSGYSN